MNEFKGVVLNSFSISRHFMPAPSTYSYEIHSKLDNAKHFETHFKENDERPIIIYVHGCDSDRAEFNRRNLCNNLANLGTI